MFDIRGDLDREFPALSAELESRAAAGVEERYVPCTFGPVSLYDRALVVGDVQPTTWWCTEAEARLHEPWGPLWRRVIQAALAHKGVRWEGVGSIWARVSGSQVRLDTDLTALRMRGPAGAWSMVRDADLTFENGALHRVFVSRSGTRGALPRPGARTREELIAAALVHVASERMSSLVVRDTPDCPINAILAGRYPALHELKWTGDLDEATVLALHAVAPALRILEVDGVTSTPLPGVEVSSRGTRVAAGETAIDARSAQQVVTSPSFATLRTVTVRAPSDADCLTLALHRPPALQRLVLREGSVGDAGARAVAGLCPNVDLSENPIPPWTVTELGATARFEGACWAPPRPDDVTAGDFKPIDTDVAMEALGTALAEARALLLRLYPDLTPPPPAVTRTSLSRWIKWAAKERAGGPTRGALLDQLASVLTCVRAGYFDGEYGLDYAIGYIQLIAWLPWASGLVGRITDSVLDASARDEQLARALHARVKALTRVPPRF